MSFLFETFSEDISSQWDGFVLGHPYGSVHQTTDWKNFQQQIPGRSTVYGFLVRDASSSQILALTWVIQMHTGLLGKFWWYSPRGPVFSPTEHKEAGIFLMKNIKKELKKSSGIFWRIDPYFSSKEWKALGVSARKSTQNYQPTDTLVLDLEKPNEVLLGEMKRKGRYNIKLADRNNIQYTSITGENFRQLSSEKKQSLIREFFTLSEETTTRDKFSGREAEYYHHFLSYLPKYAVLFFAHSDGKNIATAISTFCGGKAIYYFGASTSDPTYRKLMAPYGLQWQMIAYAKKRNCLSYDFLGIAPEGQKNHPYAGISEFKWKFGGTRETYVGGKELVLNTVWYYLYRFIKTIKGFSL